MPEIPWARSQLQVRAYVVPRYCWTTASIDVVIDGQPVLQTGGKLRVVGSHASDFQHRGASHRACQKALLFAVTRGARASWLISMWRHRRDHSAES